MAKHFGGHIKKNPLADKTQSIFKQLQDQAAGRKRAWPGKLSPEQSKLTIYSAVAYFGLLGGPENCLRSGPGTDDGNQALSFWDVAGIMLGTDRGLSDELKDILKNRIFFDREFS